MKVFIALFVAFFAYSAARTTDDVFSSSPIENQEDAAELQKEITKYNVVVRTAVPRVLGTRAVGTIGEVEANVNKLLQQEADTRRAIGLLRSTSCVDKLQVLLDSVTEFTGFESSNCVARYDLDLSMLVQKIYGEVADYEKKFNEILRVVPRAFSGRNVFLEEDDIINEYTSKLAAFRTQWNAEAKNVALFEEEFGGKIDIMNSVLGSCFRRLQANVNPTYAKITNEIETCSQFDNSHDAFAVFQ